MINDNVVAISTAIPAGRDDLTAFSCEDRIPEMVTDIDTSMFPRIILSHDTTICWPEIGSAAIISSFDPGNIFNNSSWSWTSI
jgi:hypothetical protein